MEQNVEIFGRKTFFIASDSSLIPESYVEEFLTHGYETYIIGDDYTCSLKAKIQTIVEQFPGSILFFNIDADIESIGDWKTFIVDFRKQHMDDALIGVLHHKGTAKADDALRDFYEAQLHLRCGFTVLQAHHHENFAAIQDVLEKYGARGRRQLVRATMDAASHFAFDFKGKKYKARILDTNISHFACTFPDELDAMKIYDKARKASFRLNGLKFTSDAVLLMKRTKNGVHLCIFMFITPPDDQADLPADTKKLLNRKIYQTVADETLNPLRKAFKKAEK